MKEKFINQAKSEPQSEKEKLDLVEKRVEIQKKRLEIKREKQALDKITVEKEKDLLEITDKQAQIQGKLIENKKAELDLQILKITRIIESEKLVNDKIFSVLLSLTAKSINENRSILGSEPFYEPVIKGQRRELVLDKLTELIEKL